MQWLVAYAVYATVGVSNSATASFSVMFLSYGSSCFQLKAMGTLVLPAFYALSRAVRCADVIGVAGALARHKRIAYQVLPLLALGIVELLLSLCMSMLYSCLKTDYAFFDWFLASPTLCK